MKRDWLALLIGVAGAGSTARELSREWDMERYLEMNAATIAGTGVLLAAAHHRRWLMLPGIVLPFLLMHATEGWCPQVPIFRRYGIRTRQEIDRELYAMKVLRGRRRSLERHRAFRRHLRLPIGD